MTFYTKILILDTFYFICYILISVALCKNYVKICVCKKFYAFWANCFIDPQLLITVFKQRSLLHQIRNYILLKLHHLFDRQRTNQNNFLEIRRFKIRPLDGSKSCTKLIFVLCLFFIANFNNSYFFFLYLFLLE